MTEIIANFRRTWINFYPDRGFGVLQANTPNLFASQSFTVRYALQPAFWTMPWLSISCSECRQCHENRKRRDRAFGHYVTQETKWTVYSAWANDVSKQHSTVLCRHAQICLAFASSVWHTYLLRTLQRNVARKRPQDGQHDGEYRLLTVRSVYAFIDRRLRDVTGAFVKTKQ